MQPQARPTPEVLLAHSGWMRALALGLLRDPADADDVVQDATLAALLRPPARDVPLRPWLARVVRNFAWRRVRADARRTDREQRSARPDDEPAPSEVLAQLDLQSALLDAVRALDEPLRTTVVQRYFEGRTSAEIARDSGVPAGTVRWRLKRGLDALRDGLDARFRERQAWIALLAPFSPRDLPPAALAGPAAVPVVTGAFAMTFSKIGIGAVAVSALAGLTLWAIDLGERTPVRTSAVAPPVDTELLELEPARLAAGDAPMTERSSLSAEPEHSPPVSVSAADEPPFTARVEARFVDAAGVPWPGVRFVALDPAHEADAVAPVMSAVTSGADGRARLEVRLPGHAEPVDGVRQCGFLLVAMGAGAATRKLTAQVRTDQVAVLGDIALAPGARATGRVVDPQGLAIAGAFVGVGPEELRLDGGGLRRRGGKVFDVDLAVPTRADGSFELVGIAPGRCRLWAHARGLGYGWTAVLDVPEGGAIEGVELVLEPLLPTDRVAGRVVDPDGHPVAHANLVCLARTGEHTRFEHVQADGEGRFEILVSMDGSWFDVTAEAEDDRWAPTTQKDIEPGTLDLVIRLVPVRSVLVRVRDVDGRPVEAAGFHLLVAHVSHRAEITVVEPGSYRVAYPAGEFRMDIEARGFLPEQRGPFDPERMPVELDVVLKRAARVAGRVTALGAPLAGVQVELRAHDPEAHMLVNGLRCVQNAFAISTAITDGGGGFELDCAAEGAYWVRATASGWASAEAGPFEVGPRAGVEMELTRGGSIEGYVVVASGASAEGRIVAANHGDGAARTTRAGKGGYFRFDLLAPGDWQVLARDDEIGPDSTNYSWHAGSEPIVWSCTVGVGRTNRVDIGVTGE